MNDRRILVVDDEKVIRDIMQEAFTQAGYTVQTAKDGQEALDLMRAAPFWVIFSDLNMPGMNGLELCKQIKKDWPMSICYAVTGYVSLFELSDCREAGFEDYFVKPVNLKDLFQAAENAFQKLERWKKR